MPTYVYEILDEQGEGTGACFEVVQPMSAKALTTDPDSGRPVRRVPQVPNIAGSWSPLKEKSKLGDKNLQRLGFTKYSKTGDGQYERRFGDFGEPTISRDD